MLLMALILAQKIDHLANLKITGWLITITYLAIMSYSIIKTIEFIESHFNLREELSEWLGIAICLISFGLIAIYVLDSGVMSGMMFE